MWWRCASCCGAGAHGEIRNLEHAAALAWPGVEQAVARRLAAALRRTVSTRRANSAVPLPFRRPLGALPDIVDWYAARGVTPLLSVPDRLFRLPARRREPSSKPSHGTRCLPASVPASAWR